MKDRNPISRQLLLSAGIAAALIVVGILLRGQSSSRKADAAAPAADGVTVSDAGRQIAQIEVAPVAVQRLQDAVRATGQILYPADQTVKISPRLQGRVRQVFVRVGDPVTAGQTLALLDSVD